MMGGFALPTKTIREMITGSVDIIVQASRLRDGSRKITHITEVLGMEGEVVTLQNILVYEITGEDPKTGKLHRPAPLDRHRAAEVLGARGILQSDRQAVRGARRRPRSRTRTATRWVRSMDNPETDAPARHGAVRGGAGVGVYALVATLMRGDDDAEKRLADVTENRSRKTARIAQAEQVVDAPQGRCRYAEGSRRPAEDAARRSRCACGWSAPASTISVKSFWIASGVFGVVLTVLLFVMMPQMSPVAYAAVAFIGVFGLPRWIVSKIDRAAAGQVPQRVRQRDRRDRARREVGPAAQRVPADHRAREPVAGARGVPRARRAAADRHHAVRCVRSHDGPAAAGGGEVLRDRRSASSSRRAATCPRRSATSRACCATARRWRRRCRRCRRKPRRRPAVLGSLPFVVTTLVYLSSPQYIAAAVDDQDRQLPHAVRPGLDVRRHHGHEEDDQLQVLTRCDCGYRPLATADAEEAGAAMMEFIDLIMKPQFLIMIAGGAGGVRDRADDRDADAAAGSQRAAHEGDGARARQDAQQRGWRT